MLGKDLEQYLAGEVTKILDEETVVGYEMTSGNVMAYNKNGKILWTV